MWQKINTTLRGNGNARKVEKNIYVLDEGTNRGLINNGKKGKIKDLYIDGNRVLLIIRH